MLRLFVLTLCGFIAGGQLWAQEAPGQQENVKYVSDMLYIDVRAGASSQAEKIEVIPSGTRLLILDEGAGDFVRVKLDSGTEGWVLGRYLADEPVARTRLEDALAKAETLRSERGLLYAELNKYKEERNTLKAELDKIQAEHETQSEELTDLRVTSSSAMEISSQNRRLQADLEQETKRRQEAESAAQSAYVKLFMVAAICAAVGAGLGFYVGSIPSRRDKKWRRMPM